MVSFIYQRVPLTRNTKKLGPYIQLTEFDCGTAGIPLSDATEDGEADEQLLKVIVYEDVREYLFSLSSEQARLSLLYQFIHFFGGKVSQG